MMKMKMCVLFVILALVSQHASGVEVFEAEESVLLPCKLVVPEDHAVVWKREDLTSQIVHVIVEGKDDLFNQNPRYTNRTLMRADALQTGDLSLTLRNPTFTDSGTYTCVTRKHGVDQQRTEVQLKVKERPPPPVWPKVLPAVLVPVLLLGAVIIFLLYRVKERQKLITGGRGADLWSCGGDGCLRRSVCLCFSGLFLLTAAGVCVLLLSALAVPTDAPPLLPCESVLRLVCHLVVFCPYCISTGLLLSICCSRKTPIKLPISMEMTQHRRGQELEENYDDITADVTTEHAL